MELEKIIVISLILAVLTIGVAAAEDNSTQDIESTPIAIDVIDETAQADIDEELNADEPLQELTEGEDYEINIPAEISQPGWWGFDIASVENMPFDAKGNISMKIDDIERYNQKVSPGSNALSLCDLNLNYGNHSISIIYSGDSKYAGFVRNSSFERTFFDVSCPYEFEIDGYDYSLDVSLAKDVTGYIKILIDKKTVYNKKYDAAKPPSILLSKYRGNHTYEVMYYNGNQKDVTKKDSFNAVVYRPYWDVFYNDEITYGDSVTFDIDLYGDGYGTARFKNRTYSFEFDEETWSANINISDFDIGPNTVEFTVHFPDGDSQTKEFSLFVTPQVNVPTALLTNESYELTFEASDDFNGNLTLAGMINGTYKVNDGKATVPISCKTPGNYSLSVSYGNYTWNYNMSVLEESPEVSITFIYYNEIYPWYADYDLDPDLYDFKYYINVTAMPYELTGNTEIYLDGKLVTTLSGEFQTYHIWPDYYDFGNHTIEVVYLGDETFKATTKTYNYTVHAYDCYVEKDTVNVKLLGDISGTITVSCNGKTYTKNIKRHYSYGETYAIALEGIERDVNYTIDVRFKANPSEYSFTQSFNYSRSCPIEIHEGNCIYGENNAIAFCIPNDIKNKATVTIDNKTYSYSKISTYSEEWDWLFWDDDAKLAYEVVFSDLSVGSHEVEISYPGDSKYPQTTFTEIINVTCTIKGPSEENPKNISLTLPVDAEGNLTVEIEFGSVYKIFKSVELNEGHANIELPVGGYSFRAYYTGSDYEVNDIDPYVCVYPDTTYSRSMTYGQSKPFKIADNINATLIFYIGSYYDGNKMPVAEFDLNEISTISINKNLIDAVLKNSMAKLLIQHNYNIEGYYYLGLTPVVYTGFGSVVLEHIEVNFKAKLTGAKNIAMHYGDSRSISLKVYDIYGKLVGKNKVVKIKIGKKTFNAKTDKNSIAKFKIPNTITPGKYTMTMTYKNAKVTKKLTVKQVLTLKAVKVKKSAKKLILTATLKKGKKAIKNAKVTFKFNGKTYKTKTNKYGIAKVTIKKSVLKKLKVSKNVKYQATYLKNTVKKTVKIRK
ncbi:hypothetical protein [Methanobrevibacter sp.]|uniref:hypothetical protein n=1 Tax=Methanobrevibacter sp. TaxID=66852 RepID=UPI0038701793